MKGVTAQTHPFRRADAAQKVQVAREVARHVEDVDGGIVEHVEGGGEGAEGLPVEGGGVVRGGAVGGGVGGVGEFDHLVRVQEVRFEVLVRAFARQAVLEDVHGAVAYDEGRGREVFWVAVVVVVDLRWSVWYGETKRMDPPT